MESNSVNSCKFVALAYYFFVIKRKYKPLDPFIQPNKALLIYGPRRVGKTTLLQNYLSQTALKSKLVSGDDIRVQQTLSSQNFREMLALVEGYGPDAKFQTITPDNYLDFIA